MDIYLDENTSLLLVRAVANNDALALTPSSVCEPAAIDLKRPKLHRLDAGSLLAYLGVPESRPLGIVVPRRQDRLRVRGISCSVDAMRREGAPFMQLGSASAEDPCPLVPRETRIFVQHPAHIVLSMARKLRRLQLENKLSDVQTTLMLVKLCLELCGTYSHDPFEPNGGRVIYGIGQRLTCDTLREYLKPAGSEQGLTLARKAANLAYDLSGSPQESFMGPALFFSSRLGGLALCNYVANKKLELSDAELSSIDCHQITPDFTLEDYNSVIEYLGEIHAMNDNPHKDHARSLDYQTLGKRLFEFWYTDVDTQKHFMRSASRIVSVIEQHDGPAVRKRFERLSRDPKFLARQQTLFSVFRPWLRGR